MKALFFSYFTQKVDTSYEILVAKVSSDFLSTINITVSESAILYFGVLTILMQIITIINYFEDSISQKTIRIAKVPKLKPFMTMMKILFDETTYEDNKNKSLVDILKEEA